MGRFAWICALLAACGSDSGGKSWGKSSSPPGIMNALRVWAFSPTNVWIVDGSNTIQQFNGSTWLGLPTQVASGFTCIYALSDNDVWLCAGDAVVRFDGTTFTAAQSGLTGLVSVWASSDTDVWAVGMDANIGHYNGASWSSTVAGSPNKNSIWGSGPNDVYAAGVFDVEHYNGSSWSEIQLQSSGGDQVWGTSASDVWVAGWGGKIARFNGSTWTNVTSGTTNQLLMLSGSGASDLWAAGDSNTLLHWDGTEWNPSKHGGYGTFTGVFALSAKEAWLISEKSTVLRRKLP